MNNYVSGEHHYTNFNIGNESQDFLTLQPFFFVYDFSLEEGYIEFTTSFNKTPSNLNITFDDVSVVIHEIRCNGRVLSEDEYALASGNFLIVNTTDIKQDSTPKTNYLIKFSANWKPSGTFFFSNMVSKTRIPPLSRDGANVVFLMGDKYTAVPNFTVFGKDMDSATLNSEKEIRGNFQLQSSNNGGFGSSLSFTSVDDKKLRCKNLFYNIGNGFIVGSIILLLETLSLLIERIIKKFIKIYKKILEAW